MIPPKGRAAIATLPTEQGDRFLIVTHAPGGRFHLTLVAYDDESYETRGTRWPCALEQITPSLIALGINPFAAVPWHLFDCPPDHRNPFLDLEEVEMCEHVEAAFERGVLVRSRAGG